MSAGLPVGRRCFGGHTVVPANLRAKRYPFMAVPSVDFWRRSWSRATAVAFDVVRSIVVQTDVVVSVQWKQLIALAKLDNEGYFPE